ncbi:FtsH protease activity modulator HflK [Massilia eurypsychrophila]|jgi:membrane protease subunit HflK|uniref:Protein HflK n=1 Tax=Massilia eurypsychrophila TaxID=1485217 RepID=A0A2G8T8W4_9BURK|nr:FtsH protease activity modulator HflK [Massilia eurypsychrophila]PIL42497.1 FtsH protease activity modulator HflK [Massilia eurypsychrophila]
MLVSLIRRLGVKLSLNDPRWGRRPEGDNKKQEGRKPGEGPPDLDQMWRDFNARLNRMFGQKNNGGTPEPGGYRPDMKGAGITAGVVGAVIVFIWLASGAFIVQEGQSAVVTTFGKLSHTTGAGFNWRWPYPFQQHEIVNVSQVRTAEIGYRGSVRAKNQKESLMLTDDENIIDIQFAVQYTLKDPVAWIFTNRDHDDDTIRQIAETAIREVVGKSKMDFVLYEGREKVAIDTHKLMQSIVDRYALGAQITNVTMQSVQPPEQVQSAFDDAVKAGQDRARARSEGEAYANNVIPSSRGNAIRLTQEAEAYRAMVVENATGNASRFTSVLNEYQKAPGVTRDRMYLDTMQTIFSSASKVLVDAKSGSNLLYLPLDKLIAQAAANDVAATTRTAPATAAPATTQPQEAMQTVENIRQRDSRTRENSRDRESR